MLKDTECAARYEESMAALLSSQAVTVTEPIKAVQILQEQLKALPQVEMEPVHRFSTGLYTRELTIPADTFVIGKTHRHDHPVFFMKGRVLIVDVGAGETEGVLMEAPRIWISPPGAKRALYTLTECVFATCHASSETELEILERDLIIPEPDSNHLIEARGE
jgi:hypothetical protein